MNIYIWLIIALAVGLLVNWINTLCKGGLWIFYRILCVCVLYYITLKRSKKIKKIVIKELINGSYWVINTSDASTFKGRHRIWKSKANIENLKIELLKIE